MPPILELYKLLDRIRGEWYYNYFSDIEFMNTFIVILNVSVGALTLQYKF